MTGYIDHIGLGVPDLAAAKQYYDELMPILGLKAWFPPSGWPLGNLILVWLMWQMRAKKSWSEAVFGDTDQSNWCTL